MIREFFLPVALVALLLTGCSNESNSTTVLPNGAGTNSAIQHPAVEVANSVLAAIHDGDANAIRSFFNETNRQNIVEEQFIELVEVAREIAGDTHEISELRQGTTDGVVIAKIRAQDDKVNVLVLELENGEYRLEDINTPTITEYNNLKVVQ